MTTPITQLDGSSAAFTLNGTSWTQATTVSSDALDLSASPNPLDVLITVKATFPNSTMGAQKAVNIYVAASEDGTNYDDNDQYAGSNNTKTSLRSPTNFKGPVTLAATINVVTAITFPLSYFFPRAMPRKFGIILENQCNQTIATFSASYTLVNNQF